jgi:hypothetical protein
VQFLLKFQGALDSKNKKEGKKEVRERQEGGREDKAVAELILPDSKMYCKSTAIKNST